MNRDYGTNQSEQRIAKSVGAKSHKNSGRGTVKGDATWHQFVLDIKEAPKSFTINKTVWRKICYDAMRHKDKSPALMIIMDGGVRLAVIEWEVLEELVGHN